MLTGLFALAVATQFNGELSCALVRVRRANCSDSPPPTVICLGSFEFPMLKVACKNIFKHTPIDEDNANVTGRMIVSNC